MYNSIKFKDNNARLDRAVKIANDEKQLTKMKVAELENFGHTLKDSIYRKSTLEKKIERYNMFKEFLEQVNPNISESPKICMFQTCIFYYIIDNRNFN